MFLEDCVDSNSSTNSAASTECWDQRMSESPQDRYTFPDLLSHDKYGIHNRVCKKKPTVENDR